MFLEAKIADLEMLHWQSTEARTNKLGWAVSNVGLPTNATNTLYKSVLFGQYGSTNDSELFQSTRLSVGSLRYYGLGLENGNYTLNLQFAEGLIQDPPLHESTGRRMFDVYIQLDLHLKAKLHDLVNDVE
ncbi:hypothetical protein LIER_35961 [Lithospermum erythrorhizon]|uniref:Malectin domain-containing protein n=1 Tax=Lithospermum erythrorhizon TaxID=34254 RepID=A0AAV3P008_LITER